MVERKEIKNDDLFIRAMQNSRRHFRYQNGTATVRSLNIGTHAWKDHLKEHGISWEFMDTFYYDDEQLLSFFILKWS